MAADARERLMDNIAAAMQGAAEEIVKPRFCISIGRIRLIALALQGEWAFRPPKNSKPRNSISRRDQG
jgi:hypothetical protein